MTASQSRWGGQSTVGSRWSYEDTKEHGKLSAAGGLGVLGGGAAAAYGGMRVAAGRRGISGINARQAEMYDIEGAGKLAAERAKEANDRYKKLSNAPTDKKDPKGQSKRYDKSEAKLKAAREAEASYYGKWNAKKKKHRGGGLIDQAREAYQDADSRRGTHLKAIKTGRRFVTGGALLGAGGVGAAVAADNLRRARAKPLEGGTPEFEAVMRRRNRP